MRADDPTTMIDQMLQSGRGADRGMTTFIKICGLTDEAAVQAAVNAGADARWLRFC